MLKYTHALDPVTERLSSGLQNRVNGFDSHPGLKTNTSYFLRLI